MAGSNTTELFIPTPPYHIPESMVFGYPWRLSASHEILPERIISNAQDVDPGVIRIEVGPGISHASGGPSKNPLKLLRAHSTLWLGDRFVFDARFETTRNMAHQFRHVLAAVVLARKSLTPVLGEEPEIHVVFDTRASTMAKEIYRIAGIPTILSDARVEGRIVKVTRPDLISRSAGKVRHSGSGSIFALLPEIFRDMRIGDPATDVPEKVFIARKSTRFLLNDDEITKLLESRGFTKYYFEDIPVSQQFQIMANACQIVAIHGAALAPMALNKRGLALAPGNLSGLKLVELFGPGYQVDGYRRCAAVLNAHWCAVRGKITPRVLRDLDERGLVRSHEKSPFLVDPATVEMALEYSDRAGAV
jgi:hypothetical protein